MTARVEWNDAPFLAAMMQAAEGGLDAGSAVVQRRTTQNLSRFGVRTTKNARTELERGRQIRRSVLSGTDFAGLSKARQRLFQIAQTVATIGAVDPPGGMPRTRTGNLRASITFERSGPLKRKVGPNTSVPYARIHEFGGPMKGGRPFIIIKGQFIPLGKGSKARPMGYTKPYNMPARPYLRPSFIQSKAEIHKQFAEVTRALMARKGYA